MGLLVTFVLAALLIPFAKWEISGCSASSTGLQITARSVALALPLFGMLYAHKRIRLQRLRSDVIFAASEMVSSLQELEDVISSDATLTLDVACSSASHTK